MITVVLALEVCLAGFLLYPVFTGFYTWNSEWPDWLGVSVGCWALTTAALLVLNAAYLSPLAPTSTLGPLLTTRHMLLGLNIVLVLLVMIELSGHVSWILAIASVGVITIRALLWVFTDLVWAHSFGAQQNAVYGPLRNPLSMIVLALMIASAVYSVTRRPWTSELARRSLLYAIIPGVVISALATFVPGVAGEYLIPLVLAPSLIAIQLIYFADFRRQQRRVRLIAEREARLATFGADVLSESAQVPEFAAVMLIADLLGSPCTYASGEAGEGEVITSGEKPGPGAARSAGADAVSEIVVAVEVNGTIAGVLRTSVGAEAQDDASFVRAVGAVLSAALNRSRAEESARAETLHDSLTGLPNWVLLQDRLRRLLNNAANLPIGVLCCDIQGLKDINDEFGHDAGDVVLRSIAHRLDSLSTAQGTVARIGADEFVLIEPVCDAPATDALARQIGHLGDQPTEVGEDRIQAQLRIGFSVVDALGQDPDRLVRDAEMAVMLAKREGVQAAAFSDRVRDQLVDRRRMTRDLRNAIADAEISMQYQPIVDLETSAISGVEALARWRTKSGEQVPPPVFIRLAEDIGEMLALGALIFEQAIGQLAAWTAEYPHMRKLRLSLNLSPAQMTDPHLATELGTLIGRHGIDPARITFEVTESGLEQATQAAAEYLEHFRTLGCGLSLDDFGTGYSTLTRLMAFPVTELKIDRHFVSQTHGSARVIVPAIVGLAHASGLTVVAEGIETDEQRQLVTADGCDYGQGYLFARPLSPDEVPDCVLIASQRPLGQHVPAARASG